MEFVKTVLKNELVIDNLISFHYFEFAKNYLFEGEKHNFWELAYVDKGELEVMAGTNGYVLKQGDIIFHKPNEFHSVWASLNIAPSAVMISFECSSPAMKLFENKICNLDNEDRNILSRVVMEGLNVFMPPLGSPHINTLTRKSDVPFGSEQFIRLHMEMLLLNLIRKNNQVSQSKRLSSTVKERCDMDIINKLISYMETNLTNNPNLDELCQHVNMSKSYLQAIFNQNMGCGIMEYFKKLKIKQAKKLIREEKYNFTQISDLLAYSSIHNFSRHFKSVTGVTPSEYSRSIKARLLMEDE